MSGSRDCYRGDREGNKALVPCREAGEPYVLGARLAPRGKATGKCRARWGGTSFFFFRTVFSQCAVTHLFLSFIACEHNSTGRSLGALPRHTELQGCNYKVASVGSPINKEFQELSTQLN